MGIRLYNTPSTLEKQRVRQDFEEFILARNHPCLMARSVFFGDQVRMHLYPNFGTRETAKLLLKDLLDYLKAYDENSGLVYSFMAVFNDGVRYSEEEFEQLLWKQLQYLHELDELPWDPEVSQNSEDSNFSFSLGGKAFYMVGMHPDSSRKSRQAPYPALAFNLHKQFEKLRKQDRYDKIQKRIRERDRTLQGNINPMLEDFGQGSEARQYSGRKVGKNWKCPFLHKKNQDVSAKQLPEKR